MWPVFVLGRCSLLEFGQLIPGNLVVGPWGGRVNAMPRDANEWRAYWDWSRAHYYGIRSWCENRKWRQRHAFTHMGLEE